MSKNNRSIESADSSPMWLRESAGEFLGTFVLVFFDCANIGNCSDAMNWDRCNSNDSHLLFCISSGAHLNPAVSLGMLLYGHLEFRKLPHYWLAQFAGAFLAAAIVHGFLNGPGSQHVTSSTTNACLIECAGTFLLLLVIFVLTKYNTHRFTVRFAPVFIGLTVSLLITVTSPFTSTGFNPARELGPQVFAYITGWEPVTLPDHGYANPET